MTRLPPARVVRAATAVRTALQTLTRRMVPPEVGLLELASGFMATHAVYAAAKLGIADVLANGPLSADDVAAEVGVGSRRHAPAPAGLRDASECSARTPTGASA